jgi:heme o synthase
MTTADAIANPSPMGDVVSRLRDYYFLTKPEVNLLILITTSAGYYLGSDRPFKVGAFVSTLFGTLLVASGTATLNQLMERHHDGHMRRTSGRPLASGRLTAPAAAWFGFLLSAAGGLYLAKTVNALSALLAIFTLLAYLLVYTPLKRITPLCTVLGAIPGAAPTLIGWAGATDRIDPQAWVLFAILFLWQFPHFLAIALLYRDDYARAGFRMLPRFDSDGRFTRSEIVAFTIALVLATMLPFAGHGGAAYPLCMFVAGVFLLYHTTNLTRSPSKALASRVVHASVIHLPIVLGVMVTSKVLNYALKG